MSKGSLQILENVFAVIIIIVLISLLLVFLGARVIESYRDSVQTISDREAMLIASHAAFLPEIRCSYNQDINNYCINKDKADALAGLINENSTIRELYHVYLGRSTITIRSLSNPQEIVLYEYTAYAEGHSSAHIPLLVYYPENDYYDPGWISIMVVR